MTDARSFLATGYGPLGIEQRLTMWPAMLNALTDDVVREECLSLWSALAPRYAYRRTALLLALDTTNAILALPQTDWPTILSELPAITNTAEEYLRSISATADSTDDLERVAETALLGVLPIANTLVEGLWQAGRDGILRVESATRYSRKPKVTLDVGPPEPPHGPVALFTVAGTDEAHTRLLTELVEGAIHALVSVVGSGYLAGGGTALLHLADHLRQSAYHPASVVTLAVGLEAPFRQLAASAKHDANTLLPRLAGQHRYGFDIHAGRVPWPCRGPFDATDLTIAMLNEALRTIQAIIERQHS